MGIVQFYETILKRYFNLLFVFCNHTCKDDISMLTVHIYPLSSLPAAPPSLPHAATLNGRHFVKAARLCLPAKCVQVDTDDQSEVDLQ